MEIKLIWKNHHMKIFSSLVKISHVLERSTWETKIHYEKSSYIKNVTIFTCEIYALPKLQMKIFFVTL